MCEGNDVGKRSGGSHIEQHEVVLPGPVHKLGKLPIREKRHWIGIGAAGIYNLNPNGGSIDHRLLRRRFTFQDIGKSGASMRRFTNQSAL
jgi:hypothetical protein